MPREIPRLLDPIDRVAEILFGLIMAVTIIGALSVATPVAPRSARSSRPRSAATSRGAWSTRSCTSCARRPRACEANLGQGDGSPILTARLFAEAVVVFVMVVLGTFRSSFRSC
jgi:hypothetical protein